LPVTSRVCKVTAGSYAAMFGRLYKESLNEFALAPIVISATFKIVPA